MLETVAALIQVAVTTVAANGAGALILRRHFVFHHAATRWAAETAVGFLIFSFTIFGLALVGLTARMQLRVLFALLAVGAVATLITAARRAQPSSTCRRNGWATLLGVCYLGWSVACALLPPVAADELIHHLAVPQRMLEAGGAVPFNDNIYAYFPPLGEMLFLFGLGVGGETAARLFHVAFGVTLATAMFGYSRRYLSSAAAVVPVILFFTVPSVMVILPWAYVDVMFSAYAFLAVSMLVEFFEQRTLKWAVLSGVMAAGALATKYTGLQLLLLLTLVVLAEHLFRRRKGLPTAAFAMIGVAVLIVLPVLWRNWELTGWPLFPFPLGPFPLRSGINWDGERAAMFLTMLASYGSRADPIGPASLLDSLRAPIGVFLQARFDDPRLYDGVVGPVFLLTPVVLWRSRNQAAVRPLALYSLLFLLVWALTIRQVRFLIPCVPFISILLAMGLNRWRSRIVNAAVGACLVVSTAIGVKHTLDRKPYLFWGGAETKEAFVGRHFAGYSIYQAANRHVGPGDRLYLVNMRSYGYYLKPDWRGDFVFESYQLEKQLSASSNPDDLIAFFTSRGITHLLIDERMTFSDAVLLPVQAASLRSYLDRHATVLERLDQRALYRLQR